MDKILAKGLESGILFAFPPLLPQGQAWPRAGGAGVFHRWRDKVEAIKKLRSLLQPLKDELFGESGGAG